MPGTPVVKSLHSTTRPLIFVAMVTFSVEVWHVVAPVAKLVAVMYGPQVPDEEQGYICGNAM